MQVSVFVSAKTQFIAILCCVLLACTLSPNTFAQEKETKEQEWHYTLRPSDNLQQVSKQLLNTKHTWSDLVRYNHIDNIASLEPGSIIRVPMKWLKHQPKPAKVMSISGSAQVKRTKASYFKILKANMAINVGDEVATRNGTLLIKLADGTIIRLEKNSNLVFNKLSHYGQTGMVDTRMRLKRGSLSTEVTPLVKGSRYEITTPSAVAAVRGTKFRLESSNGETKVEVTEGTVDFIHKHGKVAVHAGEGARVKQGTTSIEKSSLPIAPKAQFAENTITDLPAKLQWEDRQNSTGYRYELSDNNNKLIHSSKLKKPEVTLEHVKNGDYRVAMRAVNNKGFEGMNENSNLSIDIASEMAELLAPHDGSILDNPKPTFIWKFKDASVKGKLEVSSDPDFKTVLTRYNFEPYPQVSLNKNLAPGSYFWRIIALANNSQESTSATRKLSIRGLLKPVKILSVNYIESQVGLFWANIENANGYILQISDSSTFQNILKEETIGKSKAHLRLSPGKHYYARVKGIGNELYTSNYGPVKELFIKD